MGSPQKKNIGQLLESPYARHLPQYPSQSEGFVPNEFGGKNWSGPPTPSKQQYHGNNYQHQNNSNQRRRGNNRYFNAQRGSSGSGGNNVGGGGTGGGGGGGYRNQNSFQNNYNDHQSNRYSNSGNRQQPYHGQKYNRPDGNSRNDYYHPSMMTDPWKDLLERHNAIKNSQINIPSTTTHDSSDNDPITSSSSPDQSAISDENERPSPSATTSTSTPT